MKASSHCPRASGPLSLSLCISVSLPSTPRACVPLALFLRQSVSLPPSPISSHVDTNTPGGTEGWEAASTASHARNEETVLGDNQLTCKVPRRTLPPPACGRVTSAPAGGAPAANGAAGPSVQHPQVRHTKGPERPRPGAERVPGAVPPSQSPALSHAEPRCRGSHAVAQFTPGAVQEGTRLCYGFFSQSRGVAGAAQREALVLESSSVQLRSLPQTPPFTPRPPAELGCAPVPSRQRKLGRKTEGRLRSRTRCPSQHSELRAARRAQEPQDGAGAPACGLGAGHGLQPTAPVTWPLGRRPSGASGEHRGWQDAFLI